MGVAGMRQQSPCEKCEDCKVPHGCEKWKKSYRGRQDKINACAKELHERALKPAGKEYFTYSHPDDVRRFLRYSPCNGCQLMPDCDEPCWTYLRWYDARIELARRRIKEKDQL